MFTDTPVPKPETDGTVIWDIIFATQAFPAVYVAYELGLFEALAEGPLETQQVMKRLDIQRRPAEAMLSVNASLGLLENSDGRFRLSKTAQEYLLKASPYNLGSVMELVINNDFIGSIAKTREAVLNDRSQAYGGEDVFASHREQIEQAKRFTKSMHNISMMPALYWPEKLDLSAHEHLIDIGGGSGAHAIGALKAWQHLRGTIFDIEPVCDVAQEFIADYGLSDRLGVATGDMWETALPTGDIHFYSQIFHDWPEDKCRFLAQKSADSLPSGGRIVIHEILYHDDKTGPLPAASSSIGMLLWTEGRQYSGAEMTAMLTDAGFASVEIIPTVADWSIVTTTKP